MTYTRPHSGSASDRFTLRAFTLIEILVVVSIIAILVAILIPALAAAKAESETVACLANQRTIAQSLIMFAHQHNGYMVKGMNNGYGTIGGATVSDGAYMGAPQVWSYGAIANPPADSTATGTGNNWDQVLISDKYITPSVLRDPADTTGNVRYPAAAPKPGNTNPVNPALNVPASYRLNSSNQPADPANPTYESPIYNAYALVSITNPQNAIVICDGGFGSPGTKNYQQVPDVATWAAGAKAANADEAISGVPSSSTAGVTNVNPIIHSGKMNVAFLDGHCQTMAWGETWQLTGTQQVTGYVGLQTAWRQNFSANYGGQAETINGTAGQE